MTRLERKAKLVKLSGGCCQHCGIDWPIDIFQWHHEDDATKLFIISVALRGHDRLPTNNKIGVTLRDLWDGDGEPTELLLAELRKCTLLCSNCHLATNETNRWADALWNETKSQERENGCLDYQVALR